MKISIIIPTFNEASVIGQLLDRIRPETSRHGAEVIVSDGNSTDNTPLIVKESYALYTTSPKKGRAAQMNYGASKASGDILYFLHADCIVPEGFLSAIEKAIKRGNSSGCFRLKFDHPHWFLKANAWFTRFNVNYIRFGDQSLFISHNLFKEIGGYQEDHIVMEDQEIIFRIRKKARFTVIPRYIVTSARKYIDNGPYRLQYVFFRVWLNYYLGKSQQELVYLYKRLIKDQKIEKDDVKRNEAVDDIYQKFHSR